MSKRSPSLSNHEGERTAFSNASKIALMSRLAVFASSLAILPACNNNQLLPPEVASPPAVFVPPMVPEGPQQPEVYMKPQPKIAAGCPDKNAVGPDAEKQETDELFGSAKKPSLALSVFYKDPLNAKLYAFSHEFAANGAQALYLGLLEGRPCYGGTDYLSYSSRLPAFQKMRAYYFANAMSDPALLSVIDAKIAEHGGKKSRTP